MLQHFLTSYEMKLEYSGNDVSEKIEILLEEFFSKQERSRTIEQYLVFDRLRECNVSMFAGYVKAGKFGMSGEVSDINTGEKVTDLNTNNAAIYPHYYQCSGFDSHGKNAIFILQRIGGDGIKTAFDLALNDYLERFHSEYKIKFTPLAQTQQVKEFLNRGRASKITMEITQQSKEFFDQMDDVDENEKKKPVKVILSIPRPEGWFVSRALKSRGVVRIYNQDWTNVKIHSTMRGRQATFEVGNPYKTGIDLILDDVTQLDKDSGLPTYEYLTESANALREELLAKQSPKIPKKVPRQD